MAIHDDGDGAEKAEEDEDERRGREGGWQGQEVSHPSFAKNDFLCQLARAMICYAKLCMCVQLFVLFVMLGECSHLAFAIEGIAAAVEGIAASSLWRSMGRHR